MHDVEGKIERPVFLKEDVGKAITDMKRGKAACEEGIAVEVVKAIGALGVKKK